MSYFHKQWQNGEPINPITGKIIDPLDKTTFEQRCKRHRLETEAPIVIAEMVQFEKKMNRLGVKTVYMFPGYGEITRFMKSRYGLMQEIPRELANSGKNIELY